MTPAASPHFLTRALANSLGLLNRCPRQAACSWHLVPNREEVFDLFTSRECFEFDVMSFEFLVTNTAHPAQLLHCTQVFVRADPDNATAFANIAWAQAASGFRGSSPQHRSCRIWLDQLPDWTRLIQYLFKIGAEIHATGPHDNALLHFLWLGSCPVKSEIIIQEWLEVIESSGINVVSYLAREVSLTLQYGYFAVDRSLVPCQYRGLPGLSWAWNLDKEGPAFEVIQEFRTLTSSGRPDTYPTATDTHRDWKRPDHDWPWFGIPVANFYEEASLEAALSKVDTWRVDTKAHLREALRLYEERFERRRAKRLSKGHKRYKPLGIPGEWVD